MSKKLHRAQHHKNACNAIAATEGNFHDWVIRAAYDSAVDFVKHALFPRVLVHPRNSTSSIYNSFDAYYNAFAPYIQKDKEDALQSLVDEHLPEINTSFRRLRDLSNYARINGHKVPERSAKLSREILTVISAHCESPKSPSPAEKEVEVNAQGNS